MYIYIYIYIGTVKYINITNGSIKQQDNSLSFKFFITPKMFSLSQ